MKKAALAALAAILLAGCTETVQDRGSLPGGYGSDGYIKARNGQEIYCFLYDRGLACDFGNALGLNKK